MQTLYNQDSSSGVKLHNKEFASSLSLLLYYNVNVKFFHELQF